MNNNDFNKCTFHLYEEFKNLLRVDYVMNFFYGKIDNVINRIINGEIISACDKNIIHFKFGNGLHPRFDIFLGNETKIIFVQEFI